MFMQIYNASLRRSSLPNLRTYFELITAITDHDREIFTTITVLESRARRRFASPVDVQRIAQLRAENTFHSAMKLFETQVDAAVHILTALEARTDLKPVAAVYKHMIRAYASPTGQMKRVELIFYDFVTRSTEGAIDWTAVYDDPNGPRHEPVQVYNQIIKAHFRAGAAERAVELLAHDCLYRPRRLWPRESPPPRVPQAAETGAFLVIHVMSPRMDVPWLVRLLALVYERHTRCRMGLCTSLQEHGVPMEPAHAVHVQQAYAESHPTPRNCTRRTHPAAQVRDAHLASPMPTPPPSLPPSPTRPPLRRRVGVEIKPKTLARTSSAVIQYEMDRNIEIGKDDVEDDNAEDSSIPEEGFTVFF
ncbi:hypothetical protein B0H11DRAFT_2261791 [Mycena galericulata]|nr:hypothetical protein B0H11DRAFT_2261791 [Mycena galericulata]